MLQDAKYALKVLKSFLSGYEGLATRVDEDEWEILECDNGWEDPYYVCLQFNDGRHLPLPIFAEWDTGDDVGFFQRLAVRASKWLFGSEYDKASEQVSSFCSDETYNPNSGEMPPCRFPELSLRLNRAVRHFSFFILGLEVFIYLDRGDWTMPCFDRYTHRGESYGGGIEFGPIHIRY